MHLMPHKFNSDRRHKIAKQKFQVTNWARYNESLRVHLVVDSTGLKVFGEGEWLENKHKTKARRKRWRKLHLGFDQHDDRKLSRGCQRRDCLLRSDRG
jgi:hypothetical protein